VLVLLTMADQNNSALPVAQNIASHRTETTPELSAKSERRALAEAPCLMCHGVVDLARPASARAAASSSRIQVVLLDQRRGRQGPFTQLIELCSSPMLNSLPTSGEQICID
jgi:hypothetical protein